MEVRQPVNQTQLDATNFRIHFFSFFSINQISEIIIVLLYYIIYYYYYFIILLCVSFLSMQFERENRVLGIFPRIKFTDKDSYVASSTRIYDEVIVKLFGIGSQDVYFSVYLYCRNIHNFQHDLSWSPTGALGKKH